MQFYNGELCNNLWAFWRRKTTLLRMLASLLKPDDGFIKMGDNIWFDAKQRIDLAPQKNIGFVFQDYALFPKHSVAQNIGFGLNKKDDKAIVEEWRHS